MLYKNKNVVFIFEQKSQMCSTVKNIESFSFTNFARKE